MTAPVLNGLLVLDKPAGMTSRRALDRAARWFPRRTRLGHTGTLDPLATGVLVLCVGAATRVAEYVQRMTKTYRSTFLLGARSNTNDADGQIALEASAVVPDLDAVKAGLDAFVGKQAQIPPAFSAAKVTGQRAYDLARSGQSVTLGARLIEVHRIEILSYEYPLLDVEIVCSKGTYIRSLARDLGESLGCGALVQSLRRTRVGAFTVEDAVTLDASSENARERLLPPETALSELRRATLLAPEAKDLRQGKAIPLDQTAVEGEEFALWDEENRLLAVGRFDAAVDLLRPVKVFLPYVGERTT